MFAGDTRVIQFTIEDEDAGGPLDLTGATATWTLSEGSVVRAATVTDGPAGKCEVRLEPVDTQGWPGQVLPHQLVVVTASGDDTVVATGDVAILRRLG